MTKKSFGLNIFIAINLYKKEATAPVKIFSFVYNFIFIKIFCINLNNFAAFNDLFKNSANIG
jgi:hypothetical protein